MVTEELEMDCEKLTQSLASLRSLPAHFVRALRRGRWPEEEGVAATSSHTMYAEHEAHPDDEAPPNSLAKIVCLYTGDGSSADVAAATPGARAAKDLRIVGFHFVGMNAGEVTQGFALALRAGVTKADHDATVGIHPTDAEAFTALGTTRRSGADWVSVGGCGGGKCGRINERKKQRKKFWSSFCEED